MRAFEFLLESSPRTLYHGTLKARLPSIMQGGLEPRIGDFTKHFYDDDPDLEELVFASSKKDINKGINAIVHLLKQQGIPSTPDNIIKYGAMVVVKDEYDEFEHRPKDDMRYYGDYPRQVEPGDFYARENVGVTYILQNRKLRDLLRREGFDAWMGTKHPKLVKEEQSLSYVGNCTADDIIEYLFGDATGFAQLVDEYGDDFSIGNLVVKYNDEEDIHYFYSKA